MAPAAAEGPWDDGVGGWQETHVTGSGLAGLVTILVVAGIGGVYMFTHGRRTHRRDGGGR